MKMKKLLFVLAIAAFAVSCQSNKKNQAEMTSESMEDSVFMINDSTIGELQTYTYEGLLPCADCEGINYQLVLQTISPDSVGTYVVNATYIGADNGKDKTFTEKGKTNVMKGTPSNPNAVIIQLVGEDGETTNFIAEGDSVLTMVGNDFKKAASKLNYSIKKIAE